MRLESKIRSLIPALSCAAALLASTGFAQSIKDLPETSATGEGYVEYIGHYGEVFKLRKDFSLHPKMHGDVEVLDYHSNWRLDTKKAVPFRPTPEEIIPENFTRYGLIQLVVMPWSKATTKSLPELRRLKIADLKSTGKDFRIIDDPTFTAVSGRWPEGTFEVWISSPYRLSQLYTTTGDELCILSSGVDTPPSTVIDHSYRGLRTGLAEWVVSRETTVPKRPHSAPKKGASLLFISKPFIWAPWLLIVALAMLLNIVPPHNGRAGAFRRAWSDMTIFAHIGAVSGGIAGFVSSPYDWASHRLTIPAALVCLLMPSLAFFMARQRQLSRIRVPLIAVATWSTVTTIFLAYVALASDAGTVFAPHVAAATAIICFLAYGIGGAAFGALGEPK